MIQQVKQLLFGKPVHETQHPDIGKRAICVNDLNLFGIITDVKVDKDARCWDNICINNKQGGPHRHYWAIEGNPGVSGELFEQLKNVFV